MISMCRCDAWIKGVLSGCTVLVVNSVTRNADREFVNSLKKVVLDTRNERMVDVTLRGTCNDTWLRPLAHSC
jgi:hypothetical protein